MASESSSSPGVDRSAVRAKYDALVAAVTQAIDDADPMRLLELGAPADEYSPEIGTIVPRLSTAMDASDVRRIVHEEFVRWFGADAWRVDLPADAALRIWEALLYLRKAGQQAAAADEQRARKGRVR